MSRHQITLQFELELVDEEAAAAFAGKAFRQSGQVAPDAATPEESARKHPEVAANAIAAEALVRGAATLPWVRVGRVNFGG